MHVSSFRITNYKSFADSGLVHLESGFNVVVGRNNVGKTAFAEAVSLRFSDNPHRSLNTVPTRNAQPNPRSQIAVSITVEAGELAELLAHELSTFYVPTQPDSPGPGEVAMRTALSDGLTVEADFQPGGAHSARLSTYMGPSGSTSYLKSLWTRWVDSRIWDRLWACRVTIHN